MVASDTVARLLCTTDLARQPVWAVARDLATAGVPVFPCVPGGKRPLTEHGFHDATTNPNHVEAWWRKHPDANLAVPTGATSGIVVVDIDVHGAVDGYRAFERAHRAGLVAGWQLLIATPSGGMHAYYPATGNQEQRSWQVARAGIDFRGNGGYILIPPSTVSEAGRKTGYRVRRINTGPSATLDSDRLREFLDPRPVRRGSGREVEQSADASRLAAWVATRGEGERNRSLFWAACRLAENGVPGPDALDVLSAAASKTGLGEREITATVRSAYRTAHPPSRPSSPPVQRGSPPAVDGWLTHDGPVRPSSPVRGLS